MITILLSLAACEPAPNAEAMCALAARPSATPIAGDANGDGGVDIADGAAIHRWLFRGGPAPACQVAADVVADGVVDAGDGASVWYHLFAGSTALTALEAGVCVKAERDPEPVCGDGLALAVDAPTAAAADGTATADVTLTTGALHVEALAFGLRAEGCTITGATFEGTEAADKRDGGRRDGGFARVDVAADSLVAGIAWDIAGDASMARSSAPEPVLSVRVALPDCGRCTLTLADGPTGAGQPVTTVAAAGGYAYVPTMGSAIVEGCGGA